MSISTNGWDLIYALRFSLINQHLKSSFASEQNNINKQRTLLATSIGGGLTGKLVGVVDTVGTGYTMLPQIVVENFDNTEDSSPLLIDNFSIVDIKQNAFGSGFTSLPSVKIEGQVTSKIKPEFIIVGIQLTNPGDNYIEGAVSVSITGGGGSGARAEAVFDATGAISSITLTNPGSGYTSMPTVTIIDDQPSPPALRILATAEVIFGIKLKVDSNNLFYTGNLPENLIIELVGGGGSGASYTPVYGIGSITTNSLSVNNYIIPPVLKVKNDLADATGAGALIYATLEFKEVNFDGANVHAKFLNKLSDGFKSISGLSDNEKKYIGYALKTASDAAKTNPNIYLIDHIKTLVGFGAKVLINSNKAYQSEDIQLLKTAEDKAAGTIAAQEGKLVELRIRQKLKLAETDKVLDKLIDDEVEKVKDRVHKTLLSRQICIVTNPNKSPDDADFFVKVTDFNFNTTNGHAILESLLGALLDVLPVSYSSSIFGIAYNTENTSFPYKKVEFYTGAWQFTQGGEGKNVRIKVPINGAIIDFRVLDTGTTTTPQLVTNNALIKQSDKLYFLLEVDLNWIKSKTQARLDLDITNSYVSVIKVGKEGDPKFNFKNYLVQKKLHPKDIYLVSELINQSFDKSIEPDKTRYIPLGMNDSSYEYSHVLSKLNLIDDIALSTLNEADRKNFGWMYPSDVAYTVFDASNITKDDSNSVLAICCMTEGRKNLYSPSLSPGLIPDLSDTAILISPDILVLKFLLQAVIKLFKKQDNKPVTESDFIINSNTIINKSALILNAVGFKNEENESILGEVAAEKFTLSISGGTFNIEFANVKYPYNKKFNAYIDKKFKCLVGITNSTYENSTTGSTYKEFYINVLTGSYNITPELIDGQPESFWKSTGISIAVGVASLLVGYATSALIIKCINRKRNQTTPLSDVISKEVIGERKVELMGLKDGSASAIMEAPSLLNISQDSIMEELLKTPVDQNRKLPRFETNSNQQQHNQINKNYRFEEVSMPSKDGNYKVRFDYYDKTYGKFPNLEISLLIESDGTINQEQFNKAMKEAIDTTCRNENRYNTYNDLVGNEFFKHIERYFNNNYRQAVNCIKTKQLLENNQAPLKVRRSLEHEIRPENKVDPQLDTPKGPKPIPETASIVGALGLFVATELATSYILNKPIYDELEDRNHIASNGLSSAVNTFVSQLLNTNIEWPVDDLYVNHFEFSDCLQIGLNDNKLHTFRLSKNEPIVLGPKIKYSTNRKIRLKADVEIEVQLTFQRFDLDKKQKVDIGKSISIKINTTSKELDFDSFYNDAWKKTQAELSTTNSQLWLLVKTNSEDARNIEVNIQEK